MIAQFPKPYPDELLYSVLARQYAYSGYPSLRKFSDEIFIYKSNAVPSIEYMSPMNPEIMQHIGDNDEIIFHRTMFPAYARFQPPDKRKEALRIIRAGEAGYRDLLYDPGRNRKGKRYLKYCPECAREERSEYGECYWHVSHQIDGVIACPEHGIRLREISIPLNDSIHKYLVPAEIEIPEMGEIIEADDMEIKLSKYMNDLLYAPLDLNAPDSYQAYFMTVLHEAGYTSARGKILKMKNLQKDIDIFFEGYADLRIDTPLHTGRVLSGYYRDPAAICQLAYFLGIEVKDLSCMKEVPFPYETFDEEVMRMQLSGKPRKQVSLETGCSMNQLAFVIKRKLEEHQNMHNMPKEGINEYRKRKMDEEMLIRAKAIVGRYLDPASPPKRLTFKGMARELAVTPDMLKSLPDCCAYVRENMGVIEHYWIRCLKWNYRMFEEREHVSLNMLSGGKLKKTEYARLYPYLDDSDPLEHKIKLLLFEQYGWNLAES